MTFENLAKLTHATLLNEPFVSSFYDIVFDPHKVKRGDLFIGRDPEDVRIALSRDAYAILSDRKLPILDDEIAWLRTASIEQALINLLRYHVMEHELQICYFDEISLALLQKIASRERLLFLDGDLQTNFQTMMRAPERSIFVSSDDNLLSKINPGYSECLENEDLVTVKPVKSTLFLSSLHIAGDYFENLKLPALFIPRLQKVLTFMQKEQIAYDIQRCDFTPLFTPIFINRDLHIKSFGSTPTAIIAVSSDAILPEVIEYVTTSAPWAKICTFLPQKRPPDTEIPHYHYTDLSEIGRLKEIEFNFAIINDDLQRILQHLKNYVTTEQRFLF
ncbi:MAG TPA: hypothetical protein ENK93_03675 [Campylobacteraceae bacterium]|nr:hypothetical protein [Campylobacteraceae bacterium]HHD83955.1 hypothetical protein [Campylobacteraceae bacterium]